MHIKIKIPAVYQDTTPPPKQTNKPKNKVLCPITTVSRRRCSQWPKRNSLRLVFLIRPSGATGARCRRSSEERRRWRGESFWERGFRGAVRGADAAQRSGLLTFAYRMNQKSLKRNGRSIRWFQRGSAKKKNPAFYRLTSRDRQSWLRKDLYNFHYWSKSTV